MGLVGDVQSFNERLGKTKTIIQVGCAVSALAQQPGVLRCNLSLPSTRIRLGPIAIDGMEALLGVSLVQVLDPLMPEPRFTRTNEAGGEVDVYPLAIPDGEGASVPVKRVAIRCGLGSEETLRRTFLCHLGVNPQDYRSRFSAGAKDA